MGQASPIFASRIHATKVKGNKLRAGAERKLSDPIPGELGFGVGPCSHALPAPEWSYLGTKKRDHPWYGNYQHTHADTVSKSIMCWVPSYWLRIGHPDSPVYALYGENSIDALPARSFKTDAAASAQGYFRHRALYDGGEVKTGFFRDKTHCSASVNGVAVSAAMAPPLSSSAAHNPFSSVGATNAYWGAFQVAKSRGANFFPSSLFIEDYIAKLSMAHGQHSTSTATCAWWTSSGVSAPRGNNVNGALRDVNDASVTFTADGFGGSSSALTMSASNLAKTTHNGQLCGIADLNGNLYRVSPGVTCEGAASRTVIAATNANPCVITTSANHNFQVGQYVYPDAIVGMTQLNQRIFKITEIISPTEFAINANSTSFGVYTSGGTVVSGGTYYILKDDVRMADLTAGNTLSTDAWGANGIAANYDELDSLFSDVYPNNQRASRVGNGSNQVFSGAMSGMEWRKSCAGIPIAGGTSSSGSTVFGNDYFYQYVVNQLCPIRGGSWADGASSGIWAVHWSLARGSSLTSVGVSLALYL